MPHIKTPFPYIAVHIIQSESICCFLGNRVCFFAAISLIPSRSVQRTLAIAGVIFRTDIASAGILPFSFGRQTETVFTEITFSCAEVITLLQSEPFTQPVAKRYRIFPGNFFNRAIVIQFVE